MKIKQYPIKKLRKNFLSSLNLMKIKLQHTKTIRNNEYRSKKKVHRTNADIKNCGRSQISNNDKPEGLEEARTKNVHPEMIDGKR